MTRAVLDTMVFLRALMNRRGPWGHLFFDLRGTYVAVLSPDIVAEIIEVLNRSSLSQRLPAYGDLDWEELLDIISNAEIVQPQSRLNVCRDEADNKFFECAVEGQADYIVSEDRDILDVGEFRGVRAVPAAQFIRILEDESDDRSQAT
jgi:putative PIN family toxin of toxin-antitoxin system